ncbi:MAG: tetratricopeptide repeat protein [Anaerolineae bacterium]
MPKKKTLARSAPPPLRLYLFGPLRIEKEGEAINLGRRKVEALLAYLVLYPQAHPREHLATLFWGDSTDQQARASLRTHMMVLRKQFGDILVSDRVTCRLNSEYSLWVDTRELEKGSKDNPPTQLELYRGELLEGVDDEWIAPLRRRYRDLYIDAMLRSIQDLRSASEYEQAVQHAQAVLIQDPGNERAYQHLMFCYMALGNRSAALDAYAECVRVLQETLHVAPARETQALAEWLKQSRVERTVQVAPITNLPIPLSPFVGRAREMAAIKNLIAHGRQVTLIGPGGSGKTRLSIQVATDLIDRFSGGVWWVELAVLADPTLVPQAVAHVLGVQEKPNQPLVDAIASRIGSQKLLLILDNCEHLLAEAARLMEQLLDACPNLRVLATSREALNNASEILWQAPPLSLPDQKTTLLTDLLLSFEAIRLFVERARAVKPQFALTEQNALAVTHICQRLDGIPLAIELAAARINVLTPEQIAARLDDRFNLLTQGSRTALPRQQTLRALIDWSYDLLTPPERLLLQRLSAFRGGRNLPAIEAVCGGEGIEPSQVLELVSHLVNKSLLVTEEKQGELRYGFLDTIKAYARERLKQSGEKDRIRAKHLDYFLELAEQANSQLTGPNQIHWLDRLEIEHNNLRKAFDYGRRYGHTDQAMRLGIALAEFWDVRGYLTEGTATLQRALDAAPPPAAAHSRSYRLCYAALLERFGRLIYQQGDYGAATKQIEQSVELFRELGDDKGYGAALNSLGIVARLQGNYEASRRLLQESLALNRKLGDRYQIAVALEAQGLLDYMQGNYAAARELYQQGLELFRELGHKRKIAIALTNLGSVAQQQGEYDQARALYSQALEIQRATLDRWGMAALLTNMGNVAHSQGDYAAARALHQEGLGVMRELGNKRGMAILLGNLANACYAQGDLDTAWNGHQESLKLRREMGDKRGISLELGNLADIARVRGEDVLALRLYSEALALLCELNDWRTAINSLVGVASIATRQGRFERAAAIAGLVDARAAQMKTPLDKLEAGLQARVVETVRAQLDPVTCAARWQEGAGMTFEQAVGLVDEFRQSL